MKTIIFDFDQTIADTSVLEPLRKAGNWKSVFGALHQIKIYPGIEDLIKECRLRGYKVAVVSNSPKKYCESALALLGIQADTIVGYHDTARRKPYPDPILLALRQVGGNPAVSIGLGDSLNDIRAYQAAGIKTVSCLWGVNDTKTISSCNSNYIIEKAIDAIKHLLP